MATVAVQDGNVDAALRRLQKVLSLESLKALSADTRTHQSKGERAREKMKRNARRRQRALRRAQARAA